MPHLLPCSLVIAALGKRISKPEWRKATCVQRLNMGQSILRNTWDGPGSSCVLSKPVDCQAPERWICVLNQSLQKAHPSTCLQCKAYASVSMSACSKRRACLMALDGICYIKGVVARHVT